jgi:hypothetical protein
MTSDPIFFDIPKLKAAKLVLPPCVIPSDFGILERPTEDRETWVDSIACHRYPLGCPAQIICGRMEVDLTPS